MSIEFNKKYVCLVHILPFINLNFLNPMLRATLQIEKKNFVHTLSSISNIRETVVFYLLISYDSNQYSSVTIFLQIIQ